MEKTHGLLTNVPLLPLPPPLDRTDVLHRPYITLALYYTIPILHWPYITPALYYILHWSILHLSITPHLQPNN